MLCKGKEEDAALCEFDSHLKRNFVFCSKLGNLFLFNFTKGDGSEKCFSKRRREWRGKYGWVGGYSLFFTIIDCIILLIFWLLVKISFLLLKYFHYHVLSKCDGTLRLFKYQEIINIWLSSTIIISIYNNHYFQKIRRNRIEFRMGIFRKSWAKFSQSKSNQFLM